MALIHLKLPLDLLLLTDVLVSLILWLCRGISLLIVELIDIFAAAVALLIEQPD